MIEADRQILAAVVTNLLQNALKFARPQTTVTLRAGASAERVLIETEDKAAVCPVEYRLDPCTPRVTVATVSAIRAVMPRSS